MLDISECGDSNIRQAFAFFCRHLVCLGGWVQPVDKDGNAAGAPKPFAFSAFVLVIRGEWFLLTAGHIFKDLDDKLAKRQIKILKSYLKTGFGPEVKTHSVAKEPVYLDYETAEKTYIDHDGLDFGLLNLGTYLRAHLELNEVEPVRPENAHAPEMKFDYYVMLGFLQADVDRGELAPTMIHVDRFEGELPNDVEKPAWPRLVGRLSDKFRLSSIVGMSGGPIYGFNRNFPNKYWIAAIQISWRADHRLIFGCDVPSLARFAEVCLFEQ